MNLTGSKSIPGISGPRLSFRTAIQIALSIALLGALFYAVEPGFIADALLGAEPAGVMTALALVPLNIILTITIWWIFLTLIDSRISFRSASEAVMMGYALAVVTPARVGEIGARIYYHRALGKARLLAAFAVQGLYRTALYFGGGSIAVYYAIRSGLLDSAIWTPISVVALTGTIIIVLVGLVPRILISVVSRLPYSAKARPALDFVDRLSGRTTALLFVLSAARYLTTLSQFSILFRATGVHAEMPILMSGAGFVFFIKSFVPNLFFTDLGIREGAAVLFFQSLGEFGPEAVAAALGLFGLNAVLPALFGIPVFWINTQKNRPTLSDS